MYERHLKFSQFNILLSKTSPATHTHTHNLLLYSNFCLQACPYVIYIWQTSAETKSSNVIASHVEPLFWQAWLPNRAFYELWASGQSSHVVERLTRPETVCKSDTALQSPSFSCKPRDTMYWGFSSRTRMMYRGKWMSIVSAISSNQPGT